MIEKPEKNRDGFTLKDIIDIGEWQKLQDDFALVTGVALRTADPEGNLITRPSNEPRLCDSLLSGMSTKEQVCGECLPTFLGGKSVVDRNLSYFCHAGMCHFVTPLRYEDSDVLGYLLLGPVVLVAHGPKEDYQKIAEELNLSLDDFWKAFSEIKVVSFQGAKSLLELIKELSEYAIKLAYESKIRVEEMLKPFDLSKFRKILGSLLNVAFEISKADIGSMMVLDQKRETLSIDSSRGIPEEIAGKARVKLGEGISGTAAKEGRSYLIDDTLKDSRIKSYLSRPYLGSSMVVPLKVENRVLGVMNLGSLKTSAAQFNADTLQVINKLMDVVSTAISP